jgi:hypothetical protein
MRQLPSGSFDIDVPAGTPILVEMGAWQAWDKGSYSANLARATQRARENLRPTEFILNDFSLSAKELRDFWTETPPYLVNGDPNGARAGWPVMLEPLDVGQHELSRTTIVRGGNELITARINVFELSAENLELGTSYAQSFDSLGTSGEAEIDLPLGWTVTDKNAFNIYKFETNAEFPAPSRITGDGPHVFNAGVPEAEDRALGVYREGRSTGATVEFLANTPEIEASALQLAFALEVWDKVRGSSEGAGLLDVSVQIDRGEGFTELANLGTFETSEVAAAEGFEYIDGNSEANRLVASEVITGNIPAESQLRFRWKASHEGRDASREMVFGIDDVGISLAEAGDANFDGLVDFSDFLTLSGNFGQSGDWTQGDFDGNGETDFPDFLILSENFGTSAATSVAAVPEPGTFSLMGIALLGLLGVRRL